MKVQITAKKQPQPVAIHTEFIKLQDFLKFCGEADTGGAAKLLILDGQVLVNGEVCQMRGKKLRPGDTVCYNGKTWMVANEA